MTLVEDVLKGIGNDRKLSERVTPPFTRLLDSYNDIAKNNDDVPELGDEATGAQLKDGFSKLPVPQQIQLMHDYLVNTNVLTGQVAAEDPERAEKRRLRSWLIKFSAISGFGLMFILVGAVSVVGYRAGVFDNATISTLMSTATEIIKLWYTNH